MQEHHVVGDEEEEEAEEKKEREEKGRGERGPFSKSTHPCKNDQSHEFANRESLADQQRQR